jgi:hypothetical protein
MITSATDRGASILWIVLLTAASTVTTLVLACATPFPALAALAATQMRRRDGIALMLAAWAVSQAVGFGALHYPHDASTLAWAVALGMAAIVSVFAAGWISDRIPASGPIVRLAAAFMAASIAFKLVILLWSFGIGGVATTLSPKINAQQFLRNGTILTGLAILYKLLVTIGVPAAAPRRALPA